jgi:hypothetical protein
VLAQSAFVLQARPSAHRAEQLPPQSTSDSVPFVTPSSHAAAMHL